jgi:hypothetical protein
MGISTHRPHRLNSASFVIGSAVLVVLVGLLAALVTWAFHPAPVAPCTADCPPPQAPQAIAAVGELAEQATYTSSAYGFHVEYQSPWKVQSTNSTSAVFDARSGIFQVEGGQTTQSAVQLIQSVASSFQGSDLPDLAVVGPLNGAHIGTQPGSGELYGGTYFPPSGGGQSIPVRIGIVVAKRGALTVLAVAFAAYDAQHDIMYADDMDYALTEFRWPGE